MNEILAKRTGQAINGGSAERAENETLEESLGGDLPDGAKPSATPAAILEWEKPQWTNAEKTSAYILSKCGRYSVEKASGIYTAWRRATTREHMAINLGCHQDRELAKALCQADLEQTSGCNE